RSGEKVPMIQRRLRVVKWLNTTPAVGVCTLCSREFKVPMSALKRTADAQASLQEQFDRHRCEPPDSNQPATRVISTIAQFPLLYDGLAEFDHVIRNTRW